ncbi:MAG: hypothetical protein LBD23_02580 [Oscillospiraceae bacterium]|jgi:hypothetical protein|nr:hypothetical protein [Oscillospiraceae bacterium]
MTLFSIITSIIAIATFIISFLTLKTLRKTYKLSMNKHSATNEPHLSIIEFAIFPHKTEIYTGSNIELKGKSIEEYKQEILDSIGKTIMLKHKRTKKDYVLINSCDSELKDLSNVNLMFDALSMKLDFQNNRVDRFSIVDAYCKTKAGKKIPIMPNITIKTNNINPYTLPIAYAYESDNKVPIFYANINDYRNRKIKKLKINFLTSNSAVEKYLNLSESAYLIQCKTQNRTEPYCYSLFMEMVDDTPIMPEIEKGCSLFYEKMGETDFKGITLAPCRKCKADE